ncbi:MAG TPA: HlyD family efflux transporter periplasmic adaptor subunit [Verrucomicrobiae bacterium]|nr:HlyD family efflux transporter periplasmic adaptor subunit [Verrucomicrobiae bacterium]
MDLPRPDQARKKRRRRIVAIGGGLLLVALITIGLAQLKPAAPPVERGSLLFDNVKRGELIRQVHGNGTLVPQEIRWIPSVNQGRVERILVLPGARVKADTVLVELSNPDVTQAAFDAESLLKTAEADMANLKVQLDSQKLTQRSTVATAQANYSSAKLDLEVNEELAKAGLVPAITLKQARAKAEELASLLEIEQERLKISADSTSAQITAQETKLAQLRGQLELKRLQVQALKIRAGVDGVLQRLGDLTNPLQEGEQLPAGALVARVAEPARLKAAIKIAETQAKDIQLDQVAEIDTRNGVIPGHVIRVDPAVDNGTVTVDVALDAPLPKGARPDLSVDGTIELERLADVLYVGRPVQSQPETLVQLFKVTENGRAAVRVKVKLGRGSVSNIEVVQGLQLGDQIILSDMSQWDSFERVRLN